MRNINNYNMAVDDGSIDECGTGRYTPPPERYTPPPSYLNLLSHQPNVSQSESRRQNDISRRQERHAANAAAVTYLTRMLTDDTQTSPYEPDYDSHEEYHQITRNTRKSAESLDEIRSIMSHQEIILNLLLSIGLGITFIVIIIYCWYYYPGPYWSKDEYSHAINRLNLTDEAKQIIIDMAEKSALFKLKKCIMTNLG